MKNVCWEWLWNQNGWMPSTNKKCIKPNQNPKEKISTHNVSKMFLFSAKREFLHSLKEEIIAVHLKVPKSYRNKVLWSAKNAQKYIKVFILTEKIKMPD